ncbi:MAG TPA: exodeoxyribonuclease VII large subunit [Candidatus Paceibacterota bacterium]|nr:exodeoxyribonuclease VII large subunit [Candidatus Paceibacterota bacterium]
MDDRQLLNLFKIKREEIARREGKALFYVFSNDTLERTAASRPTSLEELKDIKGWGQKKIAAYGQEYLAIISSENQNDNEDKNSVPRAITPGAKTLVMTVAEFMSLANKALSGLGVVEVKGEIGGLSVKGDKAYFDLKDSNFNNYVVNCFLGFQEFEDYSYLLQNGLEVIVTGRPSLYQTGRFNLRLEKVEPVGQGAWQKALELLKIKLEKLGYFAPERKRAIPMPVREIGLITSETGAAITDFKKNLGNWGVTIWQVNTHVEGDLAEAEIIKALRILNLRGNLDAIVLIRGGGGAENLKVFNSEKMAEAIFNSRIPVVAGIGHERDLSIADMVADKSLSTPTAVAAYFRNQYEEILETLAEGEFTLRQGLENNLYSKSLLLNQKAITLKASLANIFASWQMTENAFIKTLSNYQFKIQENRNQLCQLEKTLPNNILNRLSSLKRNFDLKTKIFEGTDPEKPLKKGYSLIYDQDNHLIKEVKALKVGEKVKLKVKDGSAESRIEKINANF